MKKRFTAGVLLAIFTFLFLETEYLFVNIMGTLSNSRQAVSAQGIVLGVSVIGFVLYALFHRIKSAFVKRVVTVMFPLIMAVCLFFLYEADSYAICLFVGCVVFVLLGLFGSALHYHALFYVGRDSHLALLVGVAYALGWLMGKVGKKLKRQSLEAQSKWSDTMSQLEETLGGLRIIKAFIAEDKMVDRFTKCSNELRDATNKVAIRQALAHPMSEFLGTLLIVLVLWFGGILILGNDHSSLEAPTFIFYMVILYSIINPLKEFAKAGYNIPKGLASMERVDKILKAENPIKEPVNPKPLHGMNHEIEFKDVSFSYDGKREVLKHINLVVPKGQTIALVGQSGSGKSTLVDLLPRYHDIHFGEISIDGVNIKDFRIHDLRGLIGNVNQEAILFNDTFFNNIAFGVENATMEQVIEAAKIANAHDFIMETEHGYDTSIGDRGGKLSGGQRQRVSIARAILKNPPILILDEATSALDTESERLVQEALERLMKTRTTIAIAHRLSTIKNADEICVLYEGEIVERGKHEELLEKDGYYKRLNDMQSLS